VQYSQQSLTGDVEDHVLVSGGGAGQVTAVDAGVSLLGPSNDEDREGAVVRPVDAVAAVGDHQPLAAGDRSRVDRHAVDVRLGRGGPRHAPRRRVRAAAAVTVPVDLHRPPPSSSSSSSSAAAAASLPSPLLTSYCIVLCIPPDERFFDRVLLLIHTARHDSIFSRVNSCRPA